MKGIILWEREICDKLFYFKLTTESPFYILQLQRQQAKIMAFRVGERKWLEIQHEFNYSFSVSRLHLSQRHTNTENSY